jgi:Tfp pilus assembly protein PilF
MHLQQAMDAGEVHPRSLNLLARLVARDGQTKRAMDLLERSLQFQEDQPEVRRLLEELQEAASAGVRVEGRQ